MSPRLLAGATSVAFALAACSPSTPPVAEPTEVVPATDEARATPPAAATTPATVATPGPSPTGATTNAPTTGPTPTPYALSSQEVYPGAKRLAADIAATLTTYAIGTSAEDLVAGVAAPGAASEALARRVDVLHDSERWSTGQVVYPQMGGVSEDRVAVMVVVHQTLGSSQDRSDVEVEVIRTLDLRLVRDGDGWAFDELASAGGTEAERPVDLPDPAVRVLDDPRIWLPDSARWDIHRGEVREELLGMMSDLAERTTFSVVTLSSGHPFHVFGTDRQSNHTRGRAVDIFALGDRLVVDDRDEGSATHAAVAWLYEHPALSELGSPWALDGFGGRSFTDVVHQDHLHIGVRTSR